MNGWPLVAHSLRRSRALLAVTSVVLVGFQWLLTLAARGLESMNAFRQILAFLPPAVRAMAGSALAPLMSFAGMVTVGYFHVIVIAALIALAIGIGTETAGEIELRFVDLVMSRPLSRAWLPIRTLVVLALAIAVVLAAMAGGTWSGLVLFAPPEARWPSARLIGALAANLGAMTLLWGAVALCAATASRRRVVAAAATAVAALVTFIVDYVARLWEPLRGVSRISPFRYMNQLPLLTGESLPPGDFAVLLGMAAAAAAVAFVIIQRRDF